MSSASGGGYPRRDAGGSSKRKTKKKAIGKNKIEGFGTEETVRVVHKDRQSGQSGVEIMCMAGVLAGYVGLM